MLFAAGEEGKGIGGLNWLSFDAILREEFGRTRVRLGIEGSTEISGNQSRGIVGTPPPHKGWWVLLVPTCRWFIRRLP